MPVFFLFGFRNKSHEHGPTIAATCPRCHNSVVLHDVRYRRWFTLFFIPVFPLGRARRLLMCPICRWARDVPHTADELTNEMAEITRQWQAGGMADDAYSQRVDAYWSFASPAGLTAGGDDVPSEAG